MTKEQEESLKKLRRQIVAEKYTKNIGIPVYISDLKNVLSMLEEKDKTISSKDKIIDLIADEIANSITNTCPLEDYNYDLECENKCNDNYKECWKQYFENKAKE